MPQRKIRTPDGMVHVVNLLVAAKYGRHTERGISLCGLQVKPTTGTWVDDDTALSCMLCIAET